MYGIWSINQNNDLAGKAPSNHNHDGVYTPNSHSHDTVTNLGGCKLEFGTDDTKTITCNHCIFILNWYSSASSSFVIVEYSKGEIARGLYSVSTASAISKLELTVGKTETIATATITNNSSYFKFEKVAAYSGPHTSRWLAIYS